MKKIEMALYIADTLFGNHNRSKSVSEDNWKVKKLMGNKKSTLSEYYEDAVKVRKNPDNESLIA